MHLLSYRTTFLFGWVHFSPGFVKKTLKADFQFDPSRPNPGRKEKIKLKFYFQLLCGASKGFMKTLKAFKGTT